MLGWPKRWKSLETVLGSKSATWTPSPYQPGTEILTNLQEKFNVLVVGAGGLGCEILKNLALSGFRNIDVIDLDTIDISNLNRQFLFREKDVKKAKAEVAAEFIMKRVPGTKVKWYRKKIQEFELSFFKKFNLVISGLDNIEARRWLNKALIDLVEIEDGVPNFTTIIPFIDGGTEGFAGQCRLFVPMISCCFECSSNIWTPQRQFQQCTIASVPRLPEHCIAYAKTMMFPRLKSLTTAKDFEMVGEKELPWPNAVDLDSDNVHHMSWIFHRATERAAQYNIKGVTFKKTMQVVKNIIPAIASTNALVSAAVTNEALKCITWCSNGLDNWYQYQGQDGVAGSTFKYERNPACLACGTQSIDLVVPKDVTVDGLRDLLHTGQAGRDIVSNYLVRAATSPKTQDVIYKLRRVEEGRRAVVDVAGVEPRDAAKMVEDFWSDYAGGKLSDGQVALLKPMVKLTATGVETSVPLSNPTPDQEPFMSIPPDQFWSLLQVDHTLKNASINYGAKTLFMGGALASMYEGNLAKPLSTWVQAGGQVEVTDGKVMGTNRVKVTIRYE